jgi:hypothetical protein
VTTINFVTIAVVLLIGALLWVLPFKAFLVLIPTAFLGYLTYMSFDMGHKVDNLTVGYAVATIVGAVIAYAMAKSKATSGSKSKAKVKANA